MWSPTQRIIVNVPCPQPSLHAQSGSVSIPGGPLPQQVLRVFNGNSEVRAAKISEYRKIYANHFSLAVEERSARTPRGCGSVVNNLVLKHVADMALRGRGADEALGSELRHNSIDVLIAAGDFLRYIRACPGKNAFNASGISNQHNGISRHCGLCAIVEFEDCGVGRRRRYELKSGNVGLRGNAIQFGAQTLHFSWEVNLVEQNVSDGALIEELL